jgi:hypothetical protein
MDWKTSPEAAAKAAKRILGFYPEIPASDPKGFAAGLVQLLSNYPQAVIARAAEPTNGIAGSVQFLNLAAIKKHLDQWADEHWQDEKRRSPQPRLAEPPENPEMKARISRMFAELQAEMRRGQSTRPPVNEVGLAALKKQIDKGLSPSTAASEAMTLEAAVEHYKTHDLQFKPKEKKQ